MECSGSVSLFDQPAMVMATLDITSDLKSFQFENGVDISHWHLLPLRERSKGLMVTACAHAVFFCKLLHAMRREDWGPGHLHSPFTGNFLPSFSSINHEHQDVSFCTHFLPLQYNGKEKGKKSCIGSGMSRLFLGHHREWLKVGIIGGGHTGRQLALALKELSGIPAEDIHISTRRPETLKDLQELGMDCFYNNRRVVAWADVIFLCCLPSHLPSICSELRTHLPESCIVYSLVSAVPIPRLKLLLSHNSILRPKYQFQSELQGFQWGTQGTTIAALQDKDAVQATCPWSPRGGITVNATWFESVAYAALNCCKAWSLAHRESLEVLNDVIMRPLARNQEQTAYPLFERENFINKTFASFMAEDEAFPWFDLTVVQSKETPLSRLLASSPELRDTLAQVYCAFFGASLEKRGEHCLVVSSGT